MGERRPRVVAAGGALLPCGREPAIEDLTRLREMNEKLVTVFLLARFC